MLALIAALIMGVYLTYVSDNYLGLIVDSGRFVGTILTMPSNTPQKFIQVWQSSSTCASAAGALNMTPQAAASRAWAYRRRGIALKKFNRGRASLDSKALGALAKACAAYSTK